LLIPNTANPKAEAYKPPPWLAQGSAADSSQQAEVYTDEYGRIKVQYHWQRAAEHPEFGAN
jgi:type VI secretion system secreted protein VgrG